MCVSPRARGKKKQTGNTCYGFLLCLRLVVARSFQLPALCAVEVDGGWKGEDVLVWNGCFEYRGKKTPCVKRAI